MPSTTKRHRTGTSAPGSARLTRRMLSGGVVAGPVYVMVAATQALTRDEFDIRRHAVSLLSNGELGWIQITNFVVAGMLTVLAAVGMGRALASRQGGTWGPRLIGVYGVSLATAGLLVADPALGFPAGTPDGPPLVVTGMGMGHFVAGGVGFAALAGACFVFARHPVGGSRAWAPYSVATGVVFFATLAAVASGTGASGANLAFAGGVVLAWTWLSLTAGRILAGLSGAATTCESGVER